MDALKVIKIGGNIIDDEDTLAQFLEDFSAIINSSAIKAKYRFCSWWT